jgi:hypothetical protein
MRTATYGTRLGVRTAAIVLRYQLNGRRRDARRDDTYEPAPASAVRQLAGAHGSPRQTRAVPRADAADPRSPGARARESFLAEPSCRVRDAADGLRKRVRPTQHAVDEPRRGLNAYGGARMESRALPAADVKTSRTIRKRSPLTRTQSRLDYDVSRSALDIIGLSRIRPRFPWDIMTTPARTVPHSVFSPTRATTKLLRRRRLRITRRARKSRCCTRAAEVTPARSAPVIPLFGVFTPTSALSRSGLDVHFHALSHTLLRQPLSPKFGDHGTKAPSDAASVVIVLRPHCMWSPGHKRL